MLSTVDIVVKIARKAFSFAMISGVFYYIAVSKNPGTRYIFNK